MYIGRWVCAAGVLAVAAGPCSAVDVVYADLYKSIDYGQLGTAAPGAATAFHFEATVSDFFGGAKNNQINRAQLTGPVNEPMPYFSALGATINITAATREEIDSAHPNGTYSMVVDTKHDGIKTFTLDLMGDSYPNAPHITSVAVVNATTLSVTWDAMEGGTAADTILVRSQAPFGTAGLQFLDGLATSATLTVPSGNFLLGNSTLLLQFMRKVDEDGTSYPGVTAVSGYNVATSLTFTPAGLVPEPGTLGMLGLGAGLMLQRRKVK